MATELNLYDAMMTLVNSGNPADLELAKQVSNQTGIPLPAPTQSYGGVMSEGVVGGAQTAAVSADDSMIGGTNETGVPAGFSGMDFFSDKPDAFNSQPGLEGPMSANPSNARGGTPTFNDKSFQDFQDAMAAEAGKARSGQVPGVPDTGWAPTVTVANPAAVAPQTPVVAVKDLSLPMPNINLLGITPVAVPNVAVADVNASGYGGGDPSDPGNTHGGMGVSGMGDPSGATAANEGAMGGGFSTAAFGGMEHGNPNAPGMNDAAAAGHGQGDGGGGGGGSSGGGGGGGNDGGMGPGAGQSGEGGQWKSGGIIPGPKGKPRTIKAHSGEFVMNEDATNMIGADKLADLNRFALRAKAGQAANRSGVTGPKHAQDTEIAHVTPREKRMLAMMSGGEKINPVSGLSAFYDGEPGEGSAGSGTGTGAGPGSSDGNAGDTGGAGGGSDTDGSPAGDGTGTMGGNVDGAPSGGAGDMGGPADGGVGSTEAFGGPDYLSWVPEQQAPVYYIPAPEPTPTQVVSNDIDRMVRDLETYQPIAYTGNWLTYASPSGTFGGSQHRFQRRTNDPIEGNVNVYQGDRTYDPNAWPNVPVTLLGGPVNASLPGGITGLGVGPTGPLAGLKQKSGYGIMGLV